MRLRLRKSPGTLKAVIYALLVHVVVIGALVVSFRWTSEPASGPDQPIEAKVVEDPAQKAREQERARQKALEAQRRREQAEAERQRALEEERRQEEARRRAQEAEKQRQAALAKQREAERRRKEAERKKRLEAERQRQAELQRKLEQEDRQRRAEQALKEQLAAEEKQRQEAELAARATAAADQYKAIIRQKVSRNWSRPVGAEQGLECVVRVRLVPGGEVLEATVVRSSGDSVFDRSVENAVYKASPLPLPEDPDLFSFFREIEFVFKPEA